MSLNEGILDVTNKFTRLGFEITNNCNKNCKNCNLLIIVVDALRYDHLGCYGYEKNTSPNIDELCKNSIIFENAIAQSTWTKPSIISLFTSKYVKFHNITKFTTNYSLGGVDNVLPSNSLTLAEVLSSNNYKTKGLVSIIAFISPGFGIEQGFDNYTLLTRGDIEDSEVTSNAIDWLDKLDYNEKFFMYLHYSSTHAPYTPPINYKVKFKPEYSGKINFSDKHQDDLNAINLTKEDREELIARYDGEINSADYNIGNLLQYLKKKNLINKTIIVITADHGEGLGENNSLIGHGHMIEKVIHVPLIVFHPKIQSGRINITHITELIDIAPTLLSMLDLDIPEKFQGANLLNDKKFKEFGISELFREDTAIIGIRTQQYLFISFNFTPYSFYNRYSLYNIKNDPYLQEDISHKEPEILTDFIEKLTNYIKIENKEELDSGVLSKDLEERLKSLGYIQ